MSFRVFPRLIVVVALAVTGCGSGAGQVAGAGLGTVHPGTLTVAIQPYAPYTTYEGDRLTGLDGDIVNAVARKLGLTVRTKVMDFPGMLAAAQSGRVDVTLGGVAWTEERGQSGIFTDPPYYSPPALAVHGDKSFQTVEQLENKRLGTVDGYVWVDSIKAVRGAKLSVFPDSSSVVEDLKTDRIDVGILDPLIILAVEHDFPGTDIRTRYLDPPTEQQVAQHPAFMHFRPYMTSFYLPRGSEKLERAMSAEIRGMYASGELTKIIESYGGDPEKFLKPAPGLAATRRGVDRPADWTPPSI
ncbi:transporter substrate-binding domain-containing protein [Lentzea sp. NPDC051838]|uniref:substrate-binding periplasmic protein n=1 Tax=Lentzea sp. NPDC051838 TaxID=3154849 RepID=UPI00341D5404